MPDQSSGFSLDQALIRRRFNACGRQARALSLLEQEVGNRMAERLEYIRLAPKRVLDLGCGGGSDLQRLQQRYPVASFVGLDFAEKTLPPGNKPPSLITRLFGAARQTAPHLVCAEASHMPVADASFDLVWSNLMLHCLSDPAPVFAEAHRALAVEGLLMFSTLGPDTLKELRNVMPGSEGQHVHRFIDMHDLGDALVAAGFSDPVMDMEVITLTYQDCDQLFADLRGSAWQNASIQRPRGLMGRRTWTTLRGALEASRSAGRLPFSFEIIQGHAWKPQPRKTGDGRSIIRFEPRRGNAR